MADDTAKLVLSLEARFDKFEKAMLDATKVVEKQTKIIEQRFADMTKVIADKLSGIQGTLVAQTGTLGAALAALGPIGIAAAAGLGALVLALNATAAAAERINQKAINIRAFSVGTGFSIEETQGIRKALIGLGLDADTVQKAIEKFTVELNELKTTGGGPLVRALQSVDQRLVSMMINAGSTADAFQILIDALSKMDTAQRNALARSVGGRGGIGAFGEIAEQAEKFKKLMAEGIVGAKSADEINQVVIRARELAAVTKQLEAERDKFFPTDIFMQAKIEQMKQLVELFKTLNEQGAIAAAQKYFQQAFDPKNITAPIGPIETLINALRLLELARRSFTTQPTQITVNKPPALPAAQEPLADEIDKANRLREHGISLLAEEVARLETIKRLRGDLTPADAQRLAQVNLELQKAQLAKPDAAQTAAAVQGQKLLTDAFQLQTIAAKEQLGVASEQEIMQSKMIVINRALSNQIISGVEAERAAHIAAKEAREKYEATLVRSSSLPGLQRLKLDIENSSKQLDAFGTRTLETFSDNIADVILGTKTLSDAFKNMTAIILKEMIKLSIQKALIGPLFSGLSGLSGLTGKASGGPVFQGAPVLVGERGPEIFVPNTSGTVVPNSGIGGMTFAPTTNIDARGSSMDESQFRQILAVNNRALMKQIDRALPARQQRMQLLGT